MSTRAAVAGAESLGARSSIDRQWNTCERLEWKVLGNVDGKTRRHVRRAMAEFRRASQLSFAFGGIATDDEFASPPPNTLVIGFDPTLAGGRVAGLTSLWYAAAEAITDRSNRIISGARIGINPRVVERSSAGFPSALPVLLHELGHVAGLDHVDDPQELMYPLVVNVRSYRPRDVELLRRHGAAVSCPAGSDMPNR